MSEKKRTLQAALLIWAAATLVEATILNTQEGLFLPYALLGSGINYGILGLLAIPTWHLCSRIRERGLSRWRAATAYVGTLLAVLVIWQSCYLGYFYLQAGASARVPLEEAGLWFVFSAATTCGLLIAGIVLAQTARDLRQQTARRARLELLAREAEVRTLRAQLRPHFFFNVLNSIYALIETQPAEAQRMVDLVAQLMRRTLEVSNDELVSFEWELESVHAYLAIEKIRLGARLEVDTRIEVPTTDIAVPPMLLQPVVENAIKHGIAPSDQPGRIELDASNQDGQLILKIRDTGPGIDRDDAGDDGRGLDITRNRLAALYPDRHSLELRNLTPTGFEVKISMPCLPIESPPGDVIEGAVRLV